jgi:hypothetical protein
MPGIFVAQDYIMKKLIFTAITLCLYLFTFAQTTKDWKKETLERAGDHFMINLTSDHWSGAPDSINNRIKGTSRGLGIAIMIDKPFKTDPHWSVAFGLGINGSSMFFKNTYIDIKSTATALTFKNVDSADHFKKYKLVNVFAEVPVELRYTFNPEKSKSWKAALGMKVGTLINAHTKGKTLQNSAGTTIDSYTLKESKKSYFNGTRFVATARIGIGSFSLVGTYSLTSLIKDGSGPAFKPYQIGLCISGL